MGKRLDQDVTFIVKTLMRPNCLKRLLASVRKYYPTVRILVADDSPNPYPDVSKPFGAEHFPLDYDTGASYGYNYCIDRVGTPFFLLLEDDYVFTLDTAIERFVPLMALFDCLGGEVDKPKFEMRQAYEMFFEMDETSHTASGLPILKTHRVPLAVGPTRADVVLNFFCGRTELFQQVRFDDAQKVYRHLDLFLRLHYAGARVATLPGVIVEHWPERHYQYSNLRAKRIPIYIQYFLDKWGLDHVIDAGWVATRKHLEMIFGDDHPDLLYTRQALVQMGKEAVAA